MCDDGSDVALWHPAAVFPGNPGPRPRQRVRGVGVAGPAPDEQPRASAGTSDNPREARHVRAARGKMMDAGVSRGPLWSTFPSSTPGRDTRCVHPGPEGDEDRGELLPFSLGNTGVRHSCRCPFILNILSNGSAGFVFVQLKSTTLLSRPEHHVGRQPSPVQIAAHPEHLLGTLSSTAVSVAAEPWSAVASLGIQQNSSKPAPDNHHISLPHNGLPAISCLCDAHALRGRRLRSRGQGHCQLHPQLLHQLRSRRESTTSLFVFISTPPPTLTDFHDNSSTQPASSSSTPSAAASKVCASRNAPN